MNKEWKVFMLYAIVTSLAIGVAVGSLTREPAQAQTQTGQQIITRRRVIPQSVIDTFELKPATVGVFAVYGEDGQFYSLDDAMWALFQLEKGSVEHVGAARAVEKRELIMKKAASQAAADASSAKAPK